MAISFPERKLIKDTIIYIIGSFISKVMQFLLLPIITLAISPSEYGYYDLVQISTNLLIPLASVQSIEAVFRFLFNKNEEKKGGVITNAFFIFTLGNFLIILIVCLMLGFTDYIKYPALTLSYIIFVGIFMMYQKIARGFGKGTLFAVSGIINTFFLLLSQIVSLYIFKLGIEGLLFSCVLAMFVSIIFLEINIKVLSKYVSLNSINITKIKEILNFSLPLVPNSISWWALASINRYIISIFIGTTANGIYAVACKIPGLLTLFTGVFQLAWQENAIIEYEKNNNEFFGNVFNKYMRLLISALIIMLPISKLYVINFISNDYLSAFLYIPVLLFMTVFAAFTTFMGTGYISSKKTKNAFWTTLMGAFVNIAFSILFIKDIGLFAPAIGGMLAYGIVWLYRLYEMHGYFNVKPDWKLFSKLIALSGIQTAVYYCIHSDAIILCSLAISIILFLIINFQMVKSLVSLVLIRFGNLKG